jgi:hypothetical protein
MTRAISNRRKRKPSPPRLRRQFWLIPSDFRESIRVPHAGRLQAVGHHRRYLFSFSATYRILTIESQPMSRPTASRGRRLWPRSGPSLSGPPCCRSTRPLSGLVRAPHGKLVKGAPGVGGAQVAGQTRAQVIGDQTASGDLGPSGTKQRVGSFGQREFRNRLAFAYLHQWLIAGP